MLNEHLVVVSEFRDRIEQYRSALKDFNTDKYFLMSAKICLSQFEYGGIGTLIIDIDLRSMSVIQLIGKLRKNNPNMRVVFVTDQMLSSDHIDLKRVDYIVRPIQYEQVRPLLSYS